MGKVHGSLARAGKVRSQTPKVRLATFNLPHISARSLYLHHKNKALVISSLASHALSGHSFFRHDDNYHGKDVDARTWVGSTRLTKVTSQVEPQEKKKTPKGRAKKRITYTRRFVNVTMTGGKRKVSSLPSLPTTAGGSVFGFSCAVLGIGVMYGACGIVGMDIDGGVDAEGCTGDEARSARSRNVG